MTVTATSAGKTGGCPKANNVYQSFPRDFLRVRPLVPFVVGRGLDLGGPPLDTKKVPHQGRRDWRGERIDELGGIPPTVAGLASSEKTDRIIDWLGKQGIPKAEKLPWPQTTDEDRPHRINWDEVLFPRAKRTVGPDRDSIGRTTCENLDEEWVSPSDPWNPDFPGDVMDGVYGNIGRGREEFPSEENGPREDTGWDICAWYQPIHFFGQMWGIYIRQECIFSLMRKIAGFLHPTTPRSPTLVKALARAGFAVLFLHEHFHHKVESFGIRLHVVERKSSYVPYMSLVYAPYRTTKDNLEDGLANADAYYRLDTAPYKRWLPPWVCAATWDYLEWTFPRAPPGYKEADLYLSGPKLEEGTHNLQSRVHEATLTPSQPPNDWDFAPQMLRSNFNITENIYEVVSGTGRPIVGLP